MAYSHDVENLEQKADEYIDCSDGGIKAVLGVDTNYTESPEIAVSAWTQRRSEDGTLNITQDIYSGVSWATVF